MGCLLCNGKLGKLSELEYDWRKKNMGKRKVLSILLTVMLVLPLFCGVVGQERVSAAPSYGGKFWEIYSVVVQSL